MTEKNEPSLRIDWFDGTVVEETRSTASLFDDEDEPELEPAKQQYTERKLMGFKRLFDLSQQEASTLILQLSERSSFWDLLNSDLKDDFIVLITIILTKLFTSLQSGQKSLMMSNLLKTRFLTSNFLNILTEYISNLPYVKNMDKRMNLQFWNDPDLFLKNVVRLCNGMLALNKNVVEEVSNLLEAIHSGVNGLITEHEEPFAEEMFLEIQNLETILSKFICKNANNLQSPESKVNLINTESKKTNHHSNYKNLNIFPKQKDLLGKSPCDIQPNIVNGAYSSVEHYLDLQFKLLREDYFGPLREGISKYMENLSKRRHENIRVHPKVRVIRSYVSNNKVGHLIDIAWKERTNMRSTDSKKYAYNKQLLFGSLLLFTSDNFENVLFATVLDSNLNLLNDGYLAVSFHGPVSNRIYSELYLMIESEVFFEPYHRVLKVLQNAKSDIPMQKYIVNVETDTKAPSYLSAETNYSLPLKNNGEIFFPVLDLPNWPSKETFGLDSSQMEAFKLALTREFAVIQGPPGTGKTYIGVNVAQTLLNNLSFEGTPMLIICYTNHALDHFLEGILPVTNNVIRLGSQSKNEKIQPFTLRNLRMKSKSRYSYLYTNKRQEQEKIFNDMMHMQDEIEKCNKEILTYKTVKPYLNVDGKNLELKGGNEDPILKWLFAYLENDNNDEDSSDDDEDLSDWEKQLGDFDDKLSTEDTYEVESCFSEHWALKEIGSMHSSIKYVKEVTDDKFEADRMTNKFLTQINKLNKRLDCFKKNIKSFNDGCEESNKDFKILDPYKLEPDERWSLYFRATNYVKNKLMENMNNLQDKHKICSEELEEVATLVDAEVIKCARVVGVTTTAAARRHDLLQTLKSPIVIIEEAAEILEAHIIASLTHHCQHVILIGDHKQLRPTAAHYKLAKEYNLEISLFERMIRNGIHARTLTTQRRMKPQFVELIVPAVYDLLDSHPTVYEYEDVRGLKKNLFFLDHNVFEDEGMEDSWSHKNSFEAKWCIALANYLREKQYQPEDITILATYAGQASLLKEMSRKYKSLEGVKITVVDNYQGEESRIVILSLVRSNRDGKIGFLNAQNRICVALSRAKEGFYIFGNMNVLKSTSRMWNKINDVLLSQDAIGNRLTLCCDIHRENTIDVQTVENFENCLSGSCLKVCEKKTQD